MRGFFMIDTMMYVALGALLTGFIFKQVERTMIAVASYQKKLHEDAQVLGACRQLAQDLRAAPALADGWKKYSEHDMVWQQGDQDVGYSFDGHVLTRYVGTADSLGEWTRKKQYKVADGMHDVTFDLRKNDEQSTVILCRITTGRDTQKPHELVIRLRNGSI